MAGFARGVRRRVTRYMILDTRWWGNRWNRNPLQCFRKAFISCPAVFRNVRSVSGSHRRGARSRGGSPTGRPGFRPVRPGMCMSRDQPGTRHCLDWQARNGPHPVHGPGCRVQFRCPSGRTAGTCAGVQAAKCRFRARKVPRAGVASASKKNIMHTVKPATARSSNMSRRTVCLVLDVSGLEGMAGLSHN